MRQVLLIVFCIFLTACSPRETPAEIAARDNILLLGNGADPSNLDPSLTTGRPEYNILCALFEGLVTADTKTLAILPAAAESWTHENGTYTFKIRDNAKWSDGEPLKASDFVFAFRRILNPALGAEYASMLYPIKNAQKIHGGTLPAESLGAHALSEKVLKIELEYPRPDFLNLLYHNSYFPLPEHILKKYNASDRRDGVWMRPQNAVGNGPFVLTKWRVNDKVSVRKNPHYHGAQSIRLEGVDFFPISNINTEDRAFRAGQLHITESVAPTRLDAIARDMPQNLRVSDWLGAYYYIFNTTRPPLDDARVRMALSLAIDRELIIKNFLRAGQKPANSFVPTSAMDGYTPQFLHLKDVEKARRLLAEAGYPGGKNFPTITISYNTSEQHKPIAEAIQAAWKERLGIRTELYNLSWPAYLDSRKNKDFQIVRASWIADYRSPENFLNLFLSNSPMNHAGWKNKEYDALLNNAANADPAIARKNFEAAEAMLLKDAALLPIYFYSRVYLLDERVKNWNDNPLGYHDYKQVYLEGAAE